MLDNDLMFYLAGCIFFLWMIVSKRKAKPLKQEICKLCGRIIYFGLPLCTFHGDRELSKHFEREERYIQLKNPKTQMYVKVDKAKGLIVAHKKTRGPYKGIKIGC